MTKPWERVAGESIGGEEARNVEFPMVGLEPNDPFKWRRRMPEVCRFYGIVVRMYYDEHRPSHFHIFYQDHEAVLRIDTLDLTHGTLPRRALSLVVEWALAHRGELRQNWERAERGEPILSIAPLE